MAEAGNCILLAKGYTGAIRYFIPYSAKQSMQIGHGGDPFFQLCLANGLYELNLSGPGSTTLLIHMNGTKVSANTTGTSELSNGVSVVVSTDIGSVYSFVSVAVGHVSSNTSCVISLTQSSWLQNRQT